VRWVSFESLQVSCEKEGDLLAGMLERCERYRRERVRTNRVTSLDERPTLSSLSVSRLDLLDSASPHPAPTTKRAAKPKLSEGALALFGSRELVALKSEVV
jgi:hypothetical protein